MSDPLFTSKPPFLQRGRKAVLAGAGAAATAMIAGLSTEIPKTNEGWVALVTGAVVAGVVMGWSTFRIRNTGKGMVEGSDPLPAPPRPAADPGWPRPAR